MESTTQTTTLPENKPTIGFMTKESLNSPTPVPIKWIYRTVIIASSAWALIVATYPEIPNGVQLQTYKALALGTGLIYLVCNMFGWVLPKENPPAASNQQ